MVNLFYVSCKETKLSLNLNTYLFLFFLSELDVAHFDHYFKVSIILRIQKMYYLNNFNFYATNTNNLLNNFIIEIKGKQSTE